MARRCESCGAPLRAKDTECRYCGVEQETVQLHPSISNESAVAPEKREPVHTVVTNKRTVKPPMKPESTQESNTDRDVRSKVTIDFGKALQFLKAQNTAEKKYTMEDEPKAFRRKEKKKQDQNGCLIGLLQALLIVLIFTIVIYFVNIFWG